jgi:hypothetical protein
LKLCAFILKRAFATGGDNSCESIDFFLRVRGRRFAPADRIKLVSVGFESYIAIMKTFPPAMQGELRTVGVYLYGGELHHNIGAG